MGYNYDNDISPSDIDEYFDLKKDIAHIKTEILLDINNKLDNVSSKIDNLSEKIDNIHYDNINIKEDIIDLKKDNIELKNKLIDVIEIIKPLE